MLVVPRDENTFDLLFCVADFYLISKAEQFLSARFSRSEPPQKYSEHHCKDQKQKQSNFRYSNNFGTSF